MRLPRLRYTARRIVVAVAVAAPLLALGCWAWRLSTSLDEMYGPDGLLESRRRYHDEMSAGSLALQQGRYPEAEGHFRSALKLAHSPSERRYMHDPVGDEAASRRGLADALTKQGRQPEAGSSIPRDSAAQVERLGRRER